MKVLNFEGDLNIFVKPSSQGFENNEDETIILLAKNIADPITQLVITISY